MKRKLVKQGKSTMTVSLPASFVKKHNLSEGIEVELVESSNKLEICTSVEIKDKKIVVDASSHGFFTKNDLSHMYILGYDELNIKYDSSESLQQIKARVPDCIGYEIIDLTDKAITIRSISSAMEGEYDIILRKIFYMLKEMSIGIHQALNDKEYDKLKQYREMETINNKFVNFLQRLLSKNGYKKYDRTNQAYDMLQNIERIADEYKYLCDSFIGTKNRISKDSLSLLEDINNYYALLVELHYKWQPSKKMYVYSHRKALKIHAELIFKKDHIVGHHMLNILERIYNTYGSFFTMNS